jgi:hypothetical protein
MGDVPWISAEIWVHRDDLSRAQEIIHTHERGMALRKK